MSSEAKTAIPKFLFHTFDVYKLIIKWKNVKEDSSNGKTSNYKVVGNFRIFYFSYYTSHFEFGRDQEVHHIEGEVCV